MRTLRSNLAMKHRDFAAEPPENLNQMDPQIFLLSWRFLFLASFHGNSKKWVLVCRYINVVVPKKEEVSY